MSSTTNTTENSWKSVQNKPRSGRKPTSSPSQSTTTPSATSQASSSTTPSSPTNSNKKKIASNSTGSSAPQETSTMDKIHPLGETYTFSYFRKEKGMDYEDCMKNVGEFSTVEEFWTLYTHMKRPYELKVSMDYHLFKHGIKPMWEDDRNKTGGRMMLRCKSGYSARIWEDLLLAFIGQQFKYFDDINGVVISIRENHDIISIWNKSGDNAEMNEQLRVDLMNLLNLPSQTKLEYKVHQESINLHSKMLEIHTSGRSMLGGLEDDLTSEDQLEGSDGLLEDTKQR